MDAMSWSFPLGRLFGINIRVHVLLPLVAAGLILRAAFQKPPEPLPPLPPGLWIDATMLMGLMFLTVLLHEFGHCFGARLVDGDANEVLLWPLGGLAYVEVPRTARANFIATAAGPAVNLVICLVVGLLLTLATEQHFRPPFNPFWYPYRIDAEGAISLCTWSDPWFVADPTTRVTGLGTIILARLFWVSWILFLFNVLIWGFPLDGGRMFQCALWPRWGYYHATRAAVFSGFVFALLLGVCAIASDKFGVLTLGLALFIFVTCRQEWLILEQGGEESAFGYDFSQGYTSLERDQPPPRRRKQNFLQRWMQRRAQKKLQRETEQREAEERRMDELLEKVAREGLQSLTEEERRFMTRVSAKYRNRQ
jgi:Zn-dependent protease